MHHRIVQEQLQVISTLYPSPKLTTMIFDGFYKFKLKDETCFDMLAVQYLSRQRQYYRTHNHESEAK